MASHLPEIQVEHQETKGPVIIQMFEPCEKEPHCKFMLWAQILWEAHFQDAKCSKCWQDRHRETGRVIPFLPEIFVFIKSRVRFELALHEPLEQA